ncbi:hypothetical protein GDO86_008363 [Hymenochirus boettgeri]|uniref:Uncharacterized protein n=1 Tax=Hymenochirus boettgeri TaxID=247094 RepID=A0A8T2J2N3_9PIPI|nr:hypothetical protein GDO86_008363 [Hymenochirus boettgeri]
MLAPCTMPAGRRAEHKLVELLLAAGVVVNAFHKEKRPKLTLQFLLNHGACCFCPEAFCKSGCHALLFLVLPPACAVWTFVPRSRLLFLDSIGFLRQLLCLPPPKLFVDVLLIGPDFSQSTEQVSF